MKVLFINPSQEHFICHQIGWSPGIKDIGHYPPLGLLYVATHLKKNRDHVEVQVIDAASPDMPYPELEKRIKDYYPDVIGIATYTQSFIDTLKVASIAKKINPEVHINLGGHHLSHFSKETLQHQTIDSVIIGEGEITFTELVDCLAENKPIENIKGIFTRNNIEEVDKFSPAEGYVSDISQLPFPDRDMIREFSYYNALTIDKKMTTLVSSRGCPYTCTFCPLGRQPYRQRSIKDVVDEIEHYIKRGYTDFFFAEDTFNINKKKVIDFCNEIRARNLKFSWCCKARISGMDFDTLQNMAQTGCYLVNFGVETGSDAGLKELQKGTTTKEICMVFQWCKDVKIQTMAYFMIGHPFEKTREEVEKNIDFLISLEPNYCIINTLNPFPFTALFDEGVKKGLVSYEPWKQMVLTGKTFTPNNWEEFFTKEELQDLRMRGMVKFYLRSSYILKQLGSLNTLKQLLYASKVGIHILAGFLLATKKK
jgi:radical SAM superfamily enzyme YgiQ (UPF0313 family)